MVITICVWPNHTRESRRRVATYLRPRSSRCTQAPAAPCSCAYSVAETRQGEPNQRFPQGCSTQCVESPIRSTPTSCAAGCATSNGTTLNPPNPVFQHRRPLHLNPLPFRPLSRHRYPTRSPPSPKQTFGTVYSHGGASSSCAALSPSTDSALQFIWPIGQPLRSI